MRKKAVRKKSVSYPVHDAKTSTPTISVDRNEKNNKLQSVTIKRNSPDEQIMIPVREGTNDLRTGVLIYIDKDGNLQQEDIDPSKLIEHLEVGKETFISRWGGSHSPIDPQRRACW